MIFIPIAFLAATIWLTSVAVGFLNSAWNTSIQFFSFFIIFPIGAALVGALAVSGLYLGRRIFNLPFKKLYLWIALVGGLVSFFAVTYIDYNYWKSGALEYANVSISELTEAEKKEVDEALSFSKYLDLVYKKTKIQISSRRSSSVEIDNEVVSMISFWISVVGTIGGAYFAHTVAVGERTKAKNEYRDLKYRATLDYDLFDEIKKRISDKKVDRAFIEFLNENNIKTKAQNICVVRILKARSEGDGQIIAEQKAMNGKNQTVVNSAELSLDESQIDKLIEDIKMFVPKEKF